MHTSTAMRILVTASGIQNYIFNISKSKATARLRGRSALLGLVTDLCLLRLKQEFGENVREKRNAGSRLEVEVAADHVAVGKFLQGLREELDNYTTEELDGQVWFAIAEAEHAEQIHGDLAERKLRPGQAALQEGGQWKEEAFVFERISDERALEERAADQAVQEPDARLGAWLARDEETLIEFRRGGEQKGTPRLLNYNISVDKGPDKLTIQLVDENGAAFGGRKRMARHAPICPREGRLLDLSEIAEGSFGAKFLGVLKADLDGVGKTFESFRQDEEKAQKLSKALEALFTEDLEGQMKKKYPLCYIVYSGGDDLFILGPWDQLIRFIAEFEQLLRDRVMEWKLEGLTLSAGFKLAHPKSPIRYLSEDVETALEAAKKHCYPGKKVPHKNCICIFERVLAWDELRSGLDWADRFIAEVKPEGRPAGLSAGFLQRMQHYASEFRRLERGEIEGLRMVPLLQDDWHRNIERVDRTLRDALNREIRPLLVEVSDQGKRAWRVMDLATRFAIYAIR